jgi:hypothetical protein
VVCWVTAGNFCWAATTPGTNYETVIGMAETVSNVNIGRHDNILPGHFLTFPE